MSCYECQNYLQVQFMIKYYTGPELLLELKHVEWWPVKGSAGNDFNSASLGNWVQTP